MIKFKTSQQTELLKFASENNKDFGRHIEKHLKFIKKVFTVQWSSGALVIIVGSIASILFSNKPPYKPPHRAYIPRFINYQYNYAYFLILSVYEIFSPLYGATTMISIDFLIIYFFSMCASLLDELGERFKNMEVEIKGEEMKKVLKESPQNLAIFEQNHENATIKELKYCIENHVKIKELIGKTQNIVSPIISIHIVCTTAITCMTCYTISMVNIS